MPLKKPNGTPKKRVGRPRKQDFAEFGKGQEKPITPLDKFVIGADRRGKKAYPLNYYLKHPKKIHEGMQEFRRIYREAFNEAKDKEDFMRRHPFYKLLEEFCIRCLHRIENVDKRIEEAERLVREFRKQFAK